MTLPYDEYSIDSIVEYAHRLVGHTLREMIGDRRIEDFRIRRGAYGNMVETEYFKIEANSSQDPDFKQVGVELKTTPLKETKKGRLVSKERLVITSIDYHEVVRERFESSHFMKKAHLILLVSYRAEKDVDPLDCIIELAELWSIPDEDLPQIKQDWETVVRKVRDGHAENISSSDTLYLEACTKGADGRQRRSQPFSDVMAKPRAWAFKSSYMTAVTTPLLAKRRQIPRTRGEEDLTLLELIRERFSPYFGMTSLELADTFGCNPRAKSVTALITKKILGVDPKEQIDEFVKAGIVPKTMRIKRNGIPKESMSFKAMDYYEVAFTPFEDSEFYTQVTSHFLFVIYREDEEGLYRLSDVLLWQIPDDDLVHAEDCYRQMQKNIKDGRAYASVHASGNPVCHVRTHGRNAMDKSDQPFGEPAPKRSFWLNASYLAKQIDIALGS